MKKINYPVIRKHVLKTQLGKKVYRNLTISTIILIISLLVLAIIMSLMCDYCLHGGNWDTFQLSFTIAPLLFLISSISGLLMSFYVGQYTILIKTYKNK